MATPRRQARPMTDNNPPLPPQVVVNAGFQEEESLAVNEATADDDTLGDQNVALSTNQFSPLMDQGWESPIEAHNSSTSEGRAYL